MAEPVKRPLLPDENNLREALTALYLVWREYQQDLQAVRQELTELRARVEIIERDCVHNPLPGPSHFGPLGPPERGRESQQGR